MVIARAWFEVPGEWWRVLLVCVDGVPPFVSYCAEQLVAWWW